jgi:hypothetical protein
MDETWPVWFLKWVIMSSLAISMDVSSGVLGLGGHGGLGGGPGRLGRLFKD